MSERKYTKQELYMAWGDGRVSDYTNFQDYFNKTYPNDLISFDMELEKHEHVGKNREAFLGHLETALLIMKINIPMNDVEKIVAIYNCVKEHGEKTSISDLHKAVG